MAAGGADDSKGTKGSLPEQAATIKHVQASSPTTCLRERRNITPRFLPASS